MQDAPEIERLVQVITQRVQHRLRERGVVLSSEMDGGGGGSCSNGCGASACGACQMPSLASQSCSNCGINPIALPAPSVSRKLGDLSPKEMAQIIDHTLLKPDTSRDKIEELCREARMHGFFSVCVNSTMVHLAKSHLHGSAVRVCAVVGFPLGAATPGAKAYEAREALRCGADEIDMVLNIGALKSRDYALVEHDIHRVVKAVQPKVLKVILETGMLTQGEKIIACALAKAANASFVKTSTGFGPGGATVEDVALMRSIVGPEMGVKASGGVRDHATGLAMVRAGATRLGCSSSVAVVTGKQGRGGY